MDTLNRSSDTISKAASSVNEYSISDLVWTCCLTHCLAHCSNDASTFQSESMLVFGNKTSYGSNVLNYISKAGKVSLEGSTRPCN